MKITLGIIALILILLVLAYAGIKQVSSWYDTYEVKFNQILKVEVKAPFEVVKREPIVKEIVLESARPEEVNTPIKEYACKKFGSFYCLTMIAVFQAESGWDNNKWNHNTNNTLDWGIGMINSVNWKLEGCSIQEIVDPYKNIDCAWKIFDRADGQEGDNKGSFNPWVVYQRNSHLGFLK